MQNEAPFAKNFEATANPPNRKYQIVTIFMIPMSADRRDGDRLSASEYLEVFKTAPGQVTVLIRRDHGAYWNLSREMFQAAAAPDVDLSGFRPLTDAEVSRVIDALRLQIDSTRYLLGETLRAS